MRSAGAGDAKKEPSSATNQVPAFPSLTATPPFFGSVFAKSAIVDANFSLRMFTVTDAAASVGRA